MFLCNRQKISGNEIPLYVCHYDQKMFDALTPARGQELQKACEPHDTALHKSGHLILAGSLGQPKAARTLRPGKNKASVASGPYVKTDEPFGVFFIVEAKDMDEAVRIAALHPGTHVGEHLGGGIEVRPIEMFDQA